MTELEEKSCNAKAISPCEIYGKKGKIARASAILCRWGGVEGGEGILGHKFFFLNKTNN